MKGEKRIWWWWWWKRQMRGSHDEEGDNKERRGDRKGRPYGEERGTEWVQVDSCGERGGRGVSDHDERRGLLKRDKGMGTWETFFFQEMSCLNPSQLQNNLTFFI